MTQNNNHISVNGYGNCRKHMPDRSSTEGNMEEVDKRSKVLARILRDSGCKEGEPICCIMGKSPDFLVTLKAIGYADCTCIPLNPSQPVDGIQSSILESGLRWIIADRAARKLLSSDLLRNESLNLGWMDTLEELPENCLPEFVRDNIDQISLRLVVPEPNETFTPVTFYNQQETFGFEKYSFTQGDMEKFILPILEFAGVHSKSKVAGMMNCHSPSILLETMSFFKMGSGLEFLDANDALWKGFAEVVKSRGLTHLFLETDRVIELTNSIAAVNTSCSNLDTTVLWGEFPSDDVIFYRYKKFFPQTTTFKISKGHESSLQVHVNEPGSYEFEPVAGIPFKPTLSISKRKQQKM